ncbi:MAG: CPBP family intramembrane metalloprotease [Actinomycetota bacterium]|nr:CPBP family intramembrane metalloprotease [Actinomycetota bacterium]MDZ4178956.1 CPBP family intramembrane glutamic endopeptidase [Coriobacteriia bacterium]
MDPQGTSRRRAIAEGVIAYGVFAGIGLASRFVPALFVLFVAYGLLFPVAWAIVHRDWGSIGITRDRTRRAVAWGLGAGLLWAAYTAVLFGSDESPPHLALQLLIAVPVWLLVMSPFQELFFRGWLQPRLQYAIGPSVGLVATAVLFVAWHFFPKLEGTPTSTLPLDSTLGVASTLLLGVLLGYVQDRTGNVVAAWLAHALGGVALVAVGSMTFLTYT